jgi:hypothetical protein
MQEVVVSHGRHAKKKGQSAALQNISHGAMGCAPSAAEPQPVATSGGTAEEAAEKVNVRRAAPKGPIDFEGPVVSLKRYPDTNQEFFRSL